MDEANATAMQALKEENRRLKEALEWATEEMQTGTSRWFETSQPGEKYYDWFVRELRRRAAHGAEAP